MFQWETEDQEGSEEEVQEEIEGTEGTEEMEEAGLIQLSKMEAWSWINSTNQEEDWWDLVVEEEEEGQKVLFARFIIPNDW